MDVNLEVLSILPIILQKAYLVLIFKDIEEDSISEMFYVVVKGRKEDPAERIDD